MSSPFPGAAALHPGLPARLHHLPAAGLAFEFTPDMLGGAVLLAVSAVILGPWRYHLRAPQARWLRPTLWP